MKLKNIIFIVSYFIILLVGVGLTLITTKKNAEKNNNLTTELNSLSTKYSDALKVNENGIKEYNNLVNDYNELLSEYNELKMNYDELNTKYVEVTNELDKINSLTFEDEVAMIPYEISVEYLEKYKELLVKYGKSNDIRDYFTDDEIYLMQRCVETEVFGGKFECRVHVASVIMNRIAHNGFPNNVTEVITTPRQFAYFRTTITESTKLALEYAILVGDTVDGCFSFRSDIRPDTWYGWKYQFSDEVHNFYK